LLLPGTYSLRDSSDKPFAVNHNDTANRAGVVYAGYTSNTWHFHDFVEWTRMMAGSKTNTNAGLVPRIFLSYARSDLDRRGLTAFDDKNAQDRGHAVARTISVSLDMLSPDEKARYMG
jgi:hypothetical protein